MAGTGNQNVPTSAWKTLKTPNFRTESSATKDNNFQPSDLFTPETCSRNGGVPRVNNDEAERRVRRRDNHVRSALSPGCHTPRSVARNPDRNHTLESGTSTFSNVQIAEHYAICVKLSTENKINAKNAFGLHLIDLMTEVIQKQGEMTNFQVAGCTLDASAKIYAGRVDSIYADSCKMLGGLGRNDKHSEDNENDHDQAAAVSKKRTKKGVDGSVTVVEENVGSINVHSLDSEFEVDPLFKKTSAAFDEGGIESILLNHLTVDDDHYMLSLDSSSQLTLLNKPYLSSPSIICSSDLNVYFENLQSIQDNHICSTFANFTANAETWPINTEDLSQALPVCDSECPGPAHSLDDDYIEDNYELQIDDIPDEHVITCKSPGASDVLQNIQNRNIDMREFSLSDAIELSEYSYFNPMFLSTWAGPHHWKLKPHSSHDTIEVNENKIKKKKVVRKTLKVNLELVPSKDNFQKSKGSISMSAAFLKRMMSLTTVLPHVPHLDQTILYKFFFKEKLLIQRSNSINFEKDNNFNDDNLFQHEIFNTSLDDDDGTHNLDGNNDESNIQISGPTFMDLLDEVQSDGPALVAEPKKVEPLAIDYAKHAKKIDIKQIKKSILDIFSQSQNSNDTPVTFRSIHSRIESSVSSNVAKELSLPITFVCLLHLANEKCLNFTHQDDMLDFTVIL